MSHAFLSKESIGGNGFIPGPTFVSAPGSYSIPEHGRGQTHTRQNSTGKEKKNGSRIPSPVHATPLPPPGYRHETPLPQGSAIHRPVNERGRGLRYRNGRGYGNDQGHGSNTGGENKRLYETWKSKYLQLSKDIEHLTPREA